MYDKYNGYICGNGLILRTNDSINWYTYYTYINLNSIYILNIYEIIVVGDNGTIFRTYNRGLNWSLYTLSTENFNDIYMFNSDYFIIVGNNGLVLSKISTPEGEFKLYDDSVCEFRI